MKSVELITQNGNTAYMPIVEEGIEWETERKSSPGKLSFKVKYDESLKLENGNAVSFKVDDSKTFYGFIFSKKESKDKLITITAYDQLRYLKYKDTYTYTNKKASDVVRMLARDFNMNIGNIEDTEYVIASRAESDKELFDIAQNALDLTITNTKQMYVLYDNFGKLCLANIENMKVPILVDKDTGEDYDYTSSIDNDTYNQIKLTYDNNDTGKREVYIAKDSSNINKWGILQYYESIDEKTNGKAKADALLQLYNKETKNLKIKNVLGDVRVRAGCLIGVQLTLSDTKVQSFMLVEKVKHTFNNKEHLMDLTLRGGGFVV